MDNLTKFLTYIGAIALVYLGQTFFKIQTTRHNGTFNWKLLLDGFIDHLLYFIGVMCLFGSGILLPEIKIVEVNGVSMTLIDLLCYLALILYIKQSVNACKNITEKYDIKEEVGEMKVLYPSQDEVKGSDVIEVEEPKIEEIG